MHSSRTIDVLPTYPRGNHRTVAQSSPRKHCASHACYRPRLRIYADNIGTTHESQIPLTASVSTTIPTEGTNQKPLWPPSVGTAVTDRRPRPRALSNHDDRPAIAPAIFTSHRVGAYSLDLVGLRAKRPADVDRPAISPYVLSLTVYDSNSLRVQTMANSPPPPRFVISTGLQRYS